MKGERQLYRRYSEGYEQISHLPRGLCLACMAGLWMPSWQRCARARTSRAPGSSWTWTRSMRAWRSGTIPPWWEKTLGMHTLHPCHGGSPRLDTPISPAMAQTGHTRPWEGNALHKLLECAASGSPCEIRVLGISAARMGAAAHGAGAHVPLLVVMRRAAEPP